jgi:hypothetical protein
MEIALEEIRRVPGRLVLAEAPGTLWAGRNYDLVRSDDDGATWRQVSALPRSPLRRLAERSRMACRLLRHEVRALLRLADGTLVAASREGVFHGREGDRVLRPSEIAFGELPLLPPMRLGAGPNGAVVFGEYGDGRRRPIRLFASTDSGRSFEPVACFPSGTVAHIHNVIHDGSRNLYWVLAGDRDAEPGFGKLSADLRSFEWFVKGEQRFRAVTFFDLGDRLLYATDSEVEQNSLIVLDKESGKTERLRDFEGSCIYGCRFGGLMALTTTVEPSSVNRSDRSCLWLSRDGERWARAWQARKDRWSSKYFQYGSLVLPVGGNARAIVAWSGQAVEGIDGLTVLAGLSDDVRERLTSRSPRA